MLKFMLIMHLFNSHNGQYDTYIIDHDLNAADCIAAQTDYSSPLNPNAHFICEISE